MAGICYSYSLWERGGAGIPFSYSLWERGVAGIYYITNCVTGYSGGILVIYTKLPQR